jgi:Zinc-ribbon
VLHEQMIDALVAAAGPLPTEYANRKQTLLCNDCEVCLSYTAGRQHA